MIILTVAIVLMTYAGVAIGSVPRLRMNRATIALVGAATLIAVGAIQEDEAIASLDVGTILLLAAMMVINANLRLSGFFELVGGRVLDYSKSPRMLLALVILAAGVLSALFLNDTICLLFTPLVVDLTTRLKRDPIPYLIGLATATNVGSTATITGNPQNLIIGQASGISYLAFLTHLAPVALMGMAVCWVVIVLVFPHEFRGRLPLTEVDSPQIFPPLLWRTIAVVAGLLVAFLAGLPIVSLACVAAGLLLISRIRPHKLLDIDWGLLAFFGGLFVVTGTIEVTGISEDLFEAISPVIRGGVGPLSVATAILSNVISNVPAVLLLRSEMDSLANPQQGWLTLAMSSTLAGNLTLLGSAANLIVAEIAATRGVKLTFMAYLRAGVPITLITIALGVFWLNFVS
ncbi:MAG: anion transporter [Chloroflexota bacterium]|nr:anion transporter [Chloroflexota bacterium]NOG63484.1 anion transporter [Chloroflexota bacterium]GIK62344.1 MAG: anion transporter [Chloroflexota bacterium]